MHRDVKKNIAMYIHNYVHFVVWKIIYTHSIHDLPIAVPSVSDTVTVIGNDNGGDTVSRGPFTSFFL